MANVQIEKGYSKIANELFEAIIRNDMSGNMKDVLFAIIRLIYGYNKTEKEVSIGLICSITKKDRSNTSRNLNKLIEMNVVTVNGKSNLNKGRTLTINKNFENWKPYSGVVNLTTEELKGVVNLTTEELTGVVNPTTAIELKGVVNLTTEELTGVVNLTTEVLSNQQQRCCISDNPLKKERKFKEIYNIIANKKNVEVDKENEVLTKTKKPNKKESTEFTEKHNLQIWIEENCISVNKMEIQMSYLQCTKIMEQNKGEPSIVKKTLEAMENKKGLTKKYKSVYLTLKNWIENERKWNDSKLKFSNGANRPITKGEVTEDRLKQSYKKYYG